MAGMTDEFMTAVKQGKEWHLKDPNDGTIRETMPARKLWEKSFLWPRGR